MLQPVNLLQSVKDCFESVNSFNLDVLEVLVCCCYVRLDELLTNESMYVQSSTTLSQHIRC